jgi:hypothetical protein
MEPNTKLQPPVLSMLAEKLGYPHLQDWQVTLTEEILKGKDVVFTAGTGRGKTTLLYAPLLAARFQDPAAMGLSVIPTKALGLDQACCLLFLLIVHLLRPLSRNVLPAQRESLLLRLMKTLSAVHRVGARTCSRRYWRKSMGL